MFDHGFFHFDLMAEMLDTGTKTTGSLRRMDGLFEKALFPPATVYEILDDLRWGLVAFVFAIATSSPRTTIEVAKHVCWRMIRFEMTSQASGSRSPASHGPNERG